MENSVKLQKNRNLSLLHHINGSIVKRTIKKYITYKSLVLMFLPCLIYYIIFQYLPIYGVTLAFKDFRILDGIAASPWVGLKYFKLTFANAEFWMVFKNTLVISGLKLLFNFPAPILLSLLLNEVRNLRFKKTIQTITYMPHFLSWVVLSGILINFLSPSSGPINMLLVSMGLKPIYFVGSKDWFRQVLVVSSMWKEVGWGTIVYLAALAAVNSELYEAAVLDGAGRLKQTIHITLPAISPVIVIMFIFAVGGIVNDDFDQIYNLYNPAVYSVADVLSTYVYRAGLENMQYSFATAVGLFKNAVAFVLIIITNFISRKYSDYGLW
ncbi:MAG: ABC transporter permease subunit [Clostridiaceae bacterium]